MPKICPELSSVDLDGKLVEISCLEHRCEYFDQVPSTGEFVCRSKLNNLYLNDCAQLLNLVLQSGEQHRELQAQMVKSAYQRRATPEMLRLADINNQ